MLRVAAWRAISTFAVPLCISLWGACAPTQPPLSQVRADACAAITETCLPTGDWTSECAALAEILWQTVGASCRDEYLAAATHQDAALTRQLIRLCARGNGLACDALDAQGERAALALQDVKSLSNWEALVRLSTRPNWAARAAPAIGTFWRGDVAAIRILESIDRCVSPDRGMLRGVLANRANSTLLVDGLIERAKIESSSDWQAKATAIDVLGLIGDVAAIETLLAAARQKRNTTLTHRALVALSRFSPLPELAPEAMADVARCHWSMVTRSIAQEAVQRADGKWSESARPGTRVGHPSYWGRTPGAYVLDDSDEERAAQRTRFGRKRADWPVMWRGAEFRLATRMSYRPTIRGRWAEAIQRTAGCDPTLGGVVVRGGGKSYWAVAWAGVDTSVYFIEDHEQRLVASHVVVIPGVVALVMPVPPDWLLVSSGTDDLAVSSTRAVEIATARLPGAAPLPPGGASCSNEATGADAR